MHPRRLFAALPLAIAVESAAAQSTLEAAPSGRGTAAVALSYPDDATPAGAQAGPFGITIDYGQPHLRGRPLHTDSLVPYDRIWRTGANEPTMLRTEVDLTIGGAAIAKGSYFILTLPTRTGWTLILQRDAQQNPLQEYDARYDTARIPLRHRELAAPFESLTFWLIPERGARPARGELRFAWGRDELSTDWVVR